MGVRGGWRSPRNDQPRYFALQQSRRSRSWRRPWELAPEPVQRAALRSWGALPGPVRHALGPLGDVINRGHTTTSEMMPGPSIVPGVDAVRAEGFTPIEELTGFVEVALVWPEAHRRTVPETREWWLDEPLDGKVWLVRPPWRGWSLDELFILLWSVVDQQRDEEARLDAARTVLRWPEDLAAERLAVARAAL